MIDVKGVKVALLAYTAISNGQAVPHPWSRELGRPPAGSCADARRARGRGAQLVIVNLHWGAEYVHAVTPEQRALARRLTRSPAIDAIVGQHAHVVQPIRRVNGKPVVFGEGNLVSNQTAGCCPAAAQDGLIALIDFVVEPGRPRARDPDPLRAHLGAPPGLHRGAGGARHGVVEPDGERGRAAPRHPCRCAGR